MRTLAMKAAALCAMALGSFALTTAHADTFGSGGNQFTIDFVTIGNPGNPVDTGTTGLYSSSYGAVGYTFRMGKYEVSRDMITMANATVGSGGGGLGITLADMSIYGGNIGTHPATGVSWNEAARFVNWLNTSQSYAPAYKFTLQPGDGGYSGNEDIVLWQAGGPGLRCEQSVSQQRRALLPAERERVV